MKINRIAGGAILVVLFCLLVLPQLAQARQKVGVGGKLVGEIPFLVGSFRLNQFGIEAGGGMRTTSTSYGTYSYNMTLTYYLFNGKFIVPLSDRVLPYIGAGIIGASATATASSGFEDIAVSGGTNGFDVFGGVEVPFEDYGLPITAFGGMDYLGFEDMTFSYEGQSFTYPMQLGGISFHVGVKFEF